MNGLQDARSALFQGGEPAITYDEWSRLAPRLMEREAHEREELLGAENIAPADWTRADGYWSLTLASECARGDRARAEAFGQACAKELASRPLLAVPDASVLPTPAETTGAAGAVSSDARPPEPALPPSPALVVVPAVVVPTFLRPERPPPRGAPEPTWAAPSAREAARGPHPPAPSPPRPGATVDMPAFDPPAPLPFSAHPPAAPSCAAPRRPPAPQSGETLDLSQLALPAAVLPVRPEQAPPQARRDPTATVALDPDLVARMLASTPSTKR